MNIDNRNFYKLITFNNDLKILLKEISIQSFFQEYTFNEFKKIFGYTAIPLNGNPMTSFISQGNKNTITMKLNDTTTGHTTLMFIIGE